MPLTAPVPSSQPLGAAAMTQASRGNPELLDPWVERDPGLARGAGTVAFVIHGAVLKFQCGDRALH